MELYKKIKSEYVIARKNRDKNKTSILALVIGEIETEIKRGKSVSDQEIISKIKKMIENINICINAEKDEASILKLKDEIYCLGEFLPRELSEVELKHIVVEMKPKNIGEAMGFLKKNFPGQYDGKLASKVIKDFL